MIFLKNIFWWCIVFASVLAEEDDLESDVATVEFSTHHSERPIENAVNASIVTPEEIEPPISYEKERLAHLKGPNITDIEKILNNITDPMPVVELNATANATTETKNKIKVECLPRVILENETVQVILANSSVLMKVLSSQTTNKNTSSGECVVVLFYSRQCVFSARMAPHYNALARVFPDVTFYAVDITETGNLYIRYGLVYVPNIMLFHNSKPHGRFNESVINLEELVDFIKYFTGLEHNGTLNVTSADMTGPVPSVLVKKVDYILILSWLFTIFCLSVGFLKSSFCKRMVEFLRNTWHEANAAHAAQHEHED